MAETKVQPELQSEVNEVKPMTQELSRRVVIECNANAMDLGLGKVVNIKNGNAVFKPAMSQDLTDEEKAAFEAQDWNKGIITNIQLKSVSSNCPEPVTVGLNLFEGTPNIVNSSGWLFSKQTNDMTEDHAHENEGYTNVATVYHLRSSASMTLFIHLRTLLTIVTSTSMDLIHWISCGRVSFLSQTSLTTMWIKITW